eukprot:CAMPEP_0173440758 /NCGR_PEP_ID=MMETSP1357-20121228/23564_1 /TAXON_ID=77926 /ORGANISM="Hemiselmis rufescens, Strain PCC563" /LENGTH=83 /DNA_ID=CAMNT_0014406293 /DNA_START=65 /DNA_END=312 /DNA_ORIENTATION=+
MSFFPHCIDTSSDGTNTVKALAPRLTTTPAARTGSPAAVLADRKFFKYTCTLSSPACFAAHFRSLQCVHALASASTSPSPACP